MNPPLSQAERRFADKIFATQALRFSEEGFELAHHKNRPGAERSPYKVELRPPYFDESGFMLGAELFAEIVRHQKIDFGYFTGVPAGADRFVDQLVHLRGAVRFHPGRRITLKKEASPGGRKDRIVGISCWHKDRHSIEALCKSPIIIFEDCLTFATNTTEAIEVLRAAGFSQFVVIALVDREQEGCTHLRAVEVKTYCGLTISKLLSLGLSQKVISEKQVTRVLSYMATHQSRS